MKKILSYFGKGLNFFIPKNKSYIYIEPHGNGKKDCFDLMNCGADNVLKVINYFIREYRGKCVRVYIEIYNFERIRFLNEYVSKISSNDVQIVFVRSVWEIENRKFDDYLRLITNSIKRYRCKFWFCDTGAAHFDDNVKSQVLVNFQYGIEGKRATMKYKPINYFSYCIQPSAFAAIVASCKFGIDLEKYQILGYPRNDSIGSSDCMEKIREWLYKIGCEGKRIIIYAPTYRTEAIDLSKTNIFGFEDNGWLDSFLERHNAVLISKTHPHQKIFNANYSKNIISYESNYEFTIYDVFAVSDMLISDYSSIAWDYVISHKPIIYLINDLDKYNSDRGLLYEPYEYVCCGAVAHSWEEMKSALEDSFTNFKGYHDSLLFHTLTKYDDFCSTKRNYDFICKLLDE